MDSSGFYILIYELRGLILSSCQDLWLGQHIKDNYWEKAPLTSHLNSKIQAGWKHFLRLAGGGPQFRLNAVQFNKSPHSAMPVAGVHSALTTRK